MTDLLKFSPANSKLIKLQKKLKLPVYSFSQLSGHTCPYAKDCMSKAVDVDGKRHIEDGKDTQFRCFSASQEVLFKDVYNQRLHNTSLVAQAGNANKLSQLILASLPDVARVIRIHIGGDFSKQYQFDAWLKAASERPDLLFYAYTKALPFWVARMGSIPPNMVLTASRGGRKDKLIDEYKLREARVVYSHQEAIDAGLDIDNDDSHAAMPELREQSFALLIHGTQPAGTKASKAKYALGGVGSYGKVVNE